MSDHGELVDVLDAADLNDPMLSPALAHIILDSDWGQSLVSDRAALRERCEALEAFESVSVALQSLVAGLEADVETLTQERDHTATGGIDIGADLYDEPGQPAPGQDNPSVRLTRYSELRFNVEQHTFVAECGCVFEWDTTYDDPHWHQCAAHEPQEPVS